MLNPERTKVALLSFAQKVKDSTVVEIGTQGMNASGDLARSIGFDLKVNPNSFSLAFLMADYGVFQDLGVKGIKSSQKAPNSPFQFGTGTAPKGIFKTRINAWVVRKGIAPRDDSGQFTSRASLNFLIRRSILNTGLKAKNFFTKPFENAFEELPKDLVDAFALDLADFIEFTLKKQPNVK